MGIRKPINTGTVIAFFDAMPRRIVNFPDNGEEIPMQLEDFDPIPNYLEHLKSIDGKDEPIPQKIKDFIIRYIDNNFLVEEQFGKQILYINLVELRSIFGFSCTDVFNLVVNYYVRYKKQEVWCYKCNNKKYDVDVFAYNVEPFPNPLYTNIEGGCMISQYVRDEVIKA